MSGTAREEPRVAHPLRDLVNQVDKIDPATTGKPKFRYIDIGSVDGGAHRITNAQEIDSTAAPGRARQKVRTGDTVFSTVRPYLEKIARVDQSLDGEIASTGFCVLRPRPERVDAGYLFHFMTSRQLLDQVLPLQRGVSYPAVRDRDVLAARMPLPDLVVQRQIVEILENHLSRLDAASASVATASVRIRSLVAAGAAQQIRSLPPGTPMSTVGERATLVEYGSSAKASSEPEDGAVPVLRMGNVKNGALDWSNLKFLPKEHADSVRLRLEKGDLLFNRTNSAEHVGKCAVFDSDSIAIFASYLIRVRFDSTVLPGWANLVLNSPQGRSYVASVVSQQVGQANVNGTKLKSFPLPVPAIAEQERRLEAHRGTVEAQMQTERELREVAARIQRLRRSLLAAAFAGRLTGRSSDLDLAEELAGA